MTTEQNAALSAKLDAAHIRQREQSGMRLSYIESHHAIREANRIFGFDGWTSTVTALNLVQDGEQEGKRRIGYTATVTVTALGVTRQDVGFGQGIDRDAGRAHESAIKEAVSDAQKRALRTFGDAFGLALYDKAQEHVERPAVVEGQRPKSQTSAQIDKKWADWFKANGGTAQIWDALKRPGTTRSALIADLDAGSHEWVAG